MNNFNNVHDFLKQNQKLHSRIAEFYHSLSLELLDSVSAYLDKASNKTRETFIQFDPEQNIDSLFSTDFNHAHVTSEQVEALADRFNQYLTGIYQGISESNESQEVELLFDNLRQHTEQQKKQLTIDINEMNDI